MPLKRAVSSVRSSDLRTFVEMSSRLHASPARAHVRAAPSPPRPWAATNPRSASLCVTPGGSLKRGEAEHGASLLTPSTRRPWRLVRVPARARSLPSLAERYCAAPYAAFAACSVWMGICADCDSGLSRIMRCEIPFHVGLRLPTLFGGMSSPCAVRQVYVWPFQKLPR